MTTVLVTEYGIATDSLVSDGEVRTYEDKLFMGKKYAFAVAGNYELCKAAIEYIEDRRKKKLKRWIQALPDLDGENHFEVIAADLQSHVLELWDKNFRPSAVPTPYAIGSGRAGALAAWYALRDRDPGFWVRPKREGMTWEPDDFAQTVREDMRDAVAAACKVDPGSGGEIDVWMFPWA